MEKGTYFPQIQAPVGLYRSEYEHDACGMGFVARISGKPSHDIVARAVEAVVNLTHRGAVSSDGKTGDGAGVLTQIPRKLLAREAKKLGFTIPDINHLGVAMAFLPGRDAGHRDRIIQALEEAVGHYGMTLVGWRQVPVDTAALGEMGVSTLPDIRQALTLPRKGMSSDEYERALYLARKRVENVARAEGIADFHVPSMSHRTLVYKGLFVAPQLAAFYKDLADPDYESALAVFHQRYATNTFPDWFRAQPLRFLAHNGEINTLQGNRNWLKAREPELRSELWGPEAETLKPVTTNDLSDSGSLDNALELLTLSGRGVLHAMMMLIPEAWENMPNMDPAWKAFYEYHASLMEPWDGPAAISFSDGITAAGVTDRNGLRPARYKITKDGVVILASEVGVLDLPDDQIAEKGRLAPGEMIAVDTAGRKLLRNKDIKDIVSHQQPYGRWVANQRKAYTAKTIAANNADGKERLPLVQRQKAFGYTNEEPTIVIKPMIVEGKDATYSMGDDAPLALFSHVRPVLYNFFKQKFAQVTNPPIDNLREKIVMSAYTYLGARGSILEEKEAAARLIQLPAPILLDEEVEALRGESDPAFQFVTIPALFHVGDGAKGLRLALESVCEQAEDAIDRGKTIIILSDRDVDAEHAPIPMLLAVGGLHRFLIERGKRMRASIVAETAEPRDVHHFAALIGYGASAVNPYLAYETVSELIEKGEIKDVPSDLYAHEKYRTSAEQGILKIMSKMGISTVTSYHGAQIFEVLGLDAEVVGRCFTDTPSQLGGMSFEQIGEDVLVRHHKAFTEPVTPKSRLEDIGFVRYRKSGEYHMNNPIAVRALHQSVRTGSYQDYKVFSAMVNSRPPTTVRDLMTFRSDRKPVPIDQVEPVENIRKRFFGASMSLGALSPEAHEMLAMAMNYMGAMSSTGEGGEDPTRYHNLKDGYNPNSAVKQVASARFGVTPEYLAMADELEIKMAQGSKPGEGGQLPGHKVVEHIAAIRHSQPGITLISPPPHHDIYSIEDLAQLIYDLKMVNPRARITVKLVSEAGVGTIAAGVAKGYADNILISGHSGGTGASPLSSIKNAGNPWELGLAEAQQVLVANNLRGRVNLRTDGGMQVGRDVVTATILGAEKVGFGTMALISMGCEMARQCHLNTCPVGVATQREDLRAKFNGTVETVVNYFSFVAQEAREIMAQLGYTTLDDLVGRTDLLAPRTDLPAEERARFMDPRPLLANPDPTGKLPVRQMLARNVRGDEPPLDDEVLRDILPNIEDKKPVRRTYRIRNTHRTVGGRISGEIAHRYGDAGLPEGTIDLEFVGTAGQSFGAWLVNGMRLTLTGEANDYVGKGMGGGELILRPSRNATFASHENAIMGNTCLYGATNGYFFAAGRAGERFCVRASGVKAVVEGVGDHGCEYMTSGVAVILGDTGRNFGAGMSGGMAFVYDPAGEFPRNYNKELLALDRLEDSDDVHIVKDLIQRHTKATGSTRGADILAHWDSAVKDFWRVIPFQVKDKGMSLQDVLKKVEGAVTVVH